MSDSPALRLGQLVRARRLELQIHTAKALADLTNVSPRLIGDLENGRRVNFSPSTKAALEGRLLWAPGSINATLNGGNPVEIDPSEATREADSPDGEIRVWRVRDGQRVAVDQNYSDRPRLTIDEQKQQFAEDAKRQAAGISSVLALQIPLLTPEERAHVEQLGKQIEHLPEVLSPWLDLRVGQMQFMKQMSALLHEAHDILKAAVDRRKSQYPNEFDLARRPQGPPPPLSDPGVAASLREKQSDQDAEEPEVVGYVVEFYDISKGEYFGQQLTTTRAEAAGIARTKLIELGEPEDDVDQAIQEAGYTTADTRAGRYGVRIAEVHNRRPTRG